MNIQCDVGFMFADIPMSLLGSGTSKDGTTAVMFNLFFLTNGGTYTKVNPSFRSTVTTTAFDGSIAVANITEVTTAGEYVYSC